MIKEIESQFNSRMKEFERYLLNFGDEIQKPIKECKYLKNFRIAHYELYQSKKSYIRFNYRGGSLICEYSKADNIILTQFHTKGFINRNKTYTHIKCVTSIQEIIDLARSLYNKSSGQRNHHTYNVNHKSRMYETRDLMDRLEYLYDDNSRTTDLKIHNKVIKIPHYYIIM